MTTVSLYWLSVVGSARKFTSQTESRIEYIMPTDNIVVLIDTFYEKKLILLASFDIM